MIKEAVSERLRALRGTKTLEVYARELGTNTSNLYRYENDRMPSAEFLWALAEKGININWLLTGEGPVYIQRPDESVQATGNRGVDEEAWQDGPPPEWMVRIHQQIQGDPRLLDIWIALGDLLRVTPLELVAPFVEKLLVLFESKRQSTPVGHGTREEG